MNQKQFDLLANRSNLRGVTRTGAALCLLDGESMNSAARHVGCSVSTLSRAVRRLNRPACPKCKREY